MDYSLEKIAYDAFRLAKEKGKEIYPKGHYRGGLKYKTKDFNITAMFADGPDFGGSLLSDCSYLHISYKGRRVFSHQPWYDSAWHKPGIWEDKLEKLVDKMSKPKRRNIKTHDCDDGECDNARWHWVPGYGWDTY